MTPSAAIAEAQLERWRAETPGVAGRAHLNNAGAALPPTVVTEAMTAHLAREATIGGYEAADEAADAITDTYDALAELLHAAPRNIAIVTSATHAFGQALAAVTLDRGDRIVTSQDDYVSNQLMYLSLAARRGVRFVRVPDAPEGGMDLGAFRETLRRERPRLVALSWIPTSGGVVQPAAEVGAICAAEGVPYLLDACQAVGQLDVDLGALRCDYLATTARKFLRGPRGIGVLAVSDAALARGDAPVLLDMRGAQWTAADAYALAEDARRFEQWEFPYALVLGLGAAARYALDVGVAAGGAGAHARAARAGALLAAIPGVRSLDHGARQSAIATFAVEGQDAREVVLALRAQGINTSAQGRSDALIALDRAGATSLLRVSPHYYNTDAEVARCSDALRALLG
ncbi:MAG: aminotransferase class V-fold PLP-dependent enzyme [Gemmatimonadaceae bacterium]